MKESERIIPECETDGRYKQMQCRTGQNGQRQCQCWSPMGDIMSTFPNNGYGQINNCNCYSEHFTRRNQGQPGYNAMANGQGRGNGNQVVGRHFNELGWKPEREPVCQADGRYQVRRRCSTDGYCWCIDERGMVKSDRKRDRNLICN